MISNVLLPFAAVVLLALAACDTAPQSDTALDGDGTTTIQIEVPDALAPAAEAIANPDQTFDTLRQQAGEMGDQAKIDAVAAARATAEAYARTIGQSEVEVTRAGDNAEANARQALGM